MVPMPAMMNISPMRLPQTLIITPRLRSIRLKSGSRHIIPIAMTAKKRSNVARTLDLAVQSFCTGYDLKDLGGDARLAFAVGLQG